ncbi:MAG: mannosyltransferase family protein [Thermoleophilaceae bacterium]
MAQQAISRAGAPDATRGRVGARLPLQVFAGSRLIVFLVAVASAALLSDSPRRALFDVPRLTEPLGGFGRALLSPLAHWDAVWYLGIADHGYTHAPGGGAGPDAAFFPLYPLVVRLVAVVPTPGALLVSAYVVSLACFAGALVLLDRLVSLEFGRDTARLTLLLISLWPAALYFGAPYTESLFLLLTVGAFYAARTGHAAWAGLLVALASGTRPVGALLAVPLALILWRHARSRRDLAWLALAPAGIAAYAAYLGSRFGNPLAFNSAQAFWFRGLTGPWTGVKDGTVAAVDGVRQLASGSRSHVYFTRAGGDPLIVAGQNVLLFGSLLAVLAMLVGALRRLPPAWSAWALLSIALPLSSPVGPQPLMSLPRYAAVVFPLFAWLALALRGRRALTAATLAVFTAGLVVATGYYATWHWVA